MTEERLRSLHRNGVTRLWISRYGRDRPIANVVAAQMSVDDLCSQRGTDLLEFSGESSTLAIGVVL